MTARIRRGGAPSAAVRASRPVSCLKVGSRAAQSDPRWPQITAALAAVRERHRRAVRIVDADCACGALLIESACYSHALGFTAIKGRGIDGIPTMIGRARAAARLHDPEIGLGDMAQALAREADFPADIVLCQTCHGDGDQRGIATLLAAARKRVIGDFVSASNGRPAV